jgi:hypothetical protein
MFDSRSDEKIILKCYELLNKNCYFEMTLVIEEYKNSSSVNLSKRVWNNQAWLGQAMCNMQFGATIQETTKAWGLLSKKQQKFANEIADIIIEVWRNENTQ